jgi:hypothetical protein
MMENVIVGFQIYMMEMKGKMKGYNGEPLTNVTDFFMYVGEIIL